MALDIGTVQKLRELVGEKGQSASSLVRYLIGEAYEKALAAKGAERGRQNR